MKLYSKSYIKDESLSELGLESLKFIDGLDVFWGPIANNHSDKRLAFTNNVPFRSCKTKLNNTFIDGCRRYYHTNV